MKRLVSILNRLLAALGLLLVTVTFTPLVTWWATLLAGPWNDPRGEVLIVLAGSALDDVLGESSYWRTVYAVRAYRHHGFRRILLSGGPGERPVARAMADFLRGHGVPEECLIIEENSVSTRENALFSLPLAGRVPGRKVLLTSDYHMFRAYRAFRKAGHDVLPRPIPDIRKRGAHPLSRWTVFLDLLLESAKIGYYWARGWI